MPELLGTHETGFPSAGAKLHEMVAKHLHMQEMSLKGEEVMKPYCYIFSLL